MINLTKFIISDTEYLKINPENIDKDECEVCAKIDIDYVDEEKNICLRFGNEALSDFCYTITKSGRVQNLIDGNMNLDKSITDDLGFEWNQFYEGLIKDTDILEKYHFVSNSHKQIKPYYNSWIYNDEYGNIIFEITPFYPWHNTTKKTHPEKISYKKWIKDYKPTIKTIISKKNLKQWIIQVKELEKIYFPQFQGS